MRSRCFSSTVCDMVPSGSNMVGLECIFHLSKKRWTDPGPKGYMVVLGRQGEHMKHYCSSWLKEVLNFAALIVNCSSAESR